MSEDHSLLVEQLAERSRTRHYGKYRGIVRDVSDPDRLARIKVEVPAVYDTEDSPWARPAVPYAGDGYGFVMLPEPGDAVWVEFEAGNPRLPIWSGAYWPDSHRLPDPEGERVRVIVTKQGHKLVLDEENDEILLVHPGGGELRMAAGEIVLSLGACELKMTQTEISLNNGMVKVTTAGVSLVNDAMKIGV